MTFFVDANVVVYSWVPSEHRETCLQILEAVASGQADGRMSTAALEEVWYIEARGKAGPLDGLTEQAYAIFRPLLPVTDEAFRLAMTLGAPQLGPNDRIHAATCSIHGIETIASADSGFDRLRALRRIDPLDPRAVRRLLARERR